MPANGHKRSPEAIAKFNETMAEKRAAGWKPKRKKRTKAARAKKKAAKKTSSIPLDAVPERKKYKLKGKAVKTKRVDPRLELVRNTLMLLLEVLK